MGKAKPLIPYPDRKVFGGVSYHLIGGERTRKEADALADRMRAKGRLVRVFQPKSRNLPKYMVYARWKSL